jgi:hypothetical protein
MSRGGDISVRKAVKTLLGVRKRMVAAVLPR